MSNHGHNNEIKYAIEYHEETKHSELSLQMSRHYLDFDNRPRPFKVYLDLPSIPLPENFQIPTGDALAQIRSICPVKNSIPQQPTIDVRTLAQLLFFSAGITREIRFDSGTYYMRAASATGALYPIELYVICQDLAEIPAGIYHFCPGSFSLTKLRSGDFRRKLATMAGNNQGISNSPLTIAFTSLAWRNAWKYTARSYRHWFWDSGVIAANLLAVAISLGFWPSLVLGFVDSAVNNLLLLEQRKEAAILLAPIISGNIINNNSSLLAKSAADDDLATDSSSVPGAGNPRILPISRLGEIEYPEIWKIHEASSLMSSKEVMEWQRQLDRMRISNNFIQEKRAKILYSKEDEEQRQQHLLHQKDIQLQEKDNVVQNPMTQNIGDVILRRGSSRRFSHSAISKDQLSTILYSSTCGVPLDLGEIIREEEDDDNNNGGSSSLIDIYLIANAVEGLVPGHYFYDRHINSLKQLEIRKEIVSRNESGYLCLGQSLFSDASCVLFLMTDLDAVLNTLGNRGYRTCQFEAGVVAGKVYLSSYALGLGASGSTFFDDAVTETFSPHAKDKATMIAIGIGIPSYKARPGKVLAARLTKSDLLKS